MKLFSAIIFLSSLVFLGLTEKNETKELGHEQILRSLYQDRLHSDNLGKYLTCYTGETDSNNTVKCRVETRNGTQMYPVCRLFLVGRRGFSECSKKQHENLSDFSEECELIEFFPGMKVCHCIANECNKQE